ncbi:type I-E CRISPR-associated protein Cas5/CasD [Streptomyces sp. NPDC004134]|uniref:type I-E CRISPR-associated protein Cas5/CasD n=1 Tax=Streptomyces sp. NPDC004134 TaxID=3364691 RepID=UPI00368B4123
MSVLLLRLAGPLQAWGSSARFTRRTTENQPTKSGVLGLLAAAQGRPREADLSDLAALRFGVRTDQPGTRIRDFQTAHHPLSGKAMPLSERYYLADAVFVAGVEGEHDLIDQLHAAVREPAFLPYLGRRSCPPSSPIDLGVHQDTDLAQALRTTPWQASQPYRERAVPGIRLALQLDSPPGQAPEQHLRDQPITYDPRHRQYGLRDLVTETVPVPDLPAPAHVPAHDPTHGLGQL